MLQKKLKVGGEGGGRLPRHPGANKHTLRDCRNDRKKIEGRRERNCIGKG